jgi:hypothetical protein
MQGPQHHTGDASPGLPLRQGILETALNVLKSPLAEKGLIKKAGEMLRESAGKAVEKGVQEALGALMMMAAKRISELIAIIFR